MRKEHIEKMSELLLKTVDDISSSGEYETTKLRHIAKAYAKEIIDELDR